MARPKKWRTKQVVYWMLTEKGIDNKPNISKIIFWGKNKGRQLLVLHPNERWKPCIGFVIFSRISFVVGISCNATFVAWLLRNILALLDRLLDRHLLAGLMRYLESGIKIILKVTMAGIIWDMTMDNKLMYNVYP